MKKWKPNVKTRALRDQVRALKTDLTHASNQVGYLQRQVEATDVHRKATQADLEEITRRLRVICRHTYALKPTGKVSMRDRRVPLERRECDAGAYFSSDARWMDRPIDSIDLAQLLFWAEKNPVQFARYMHFEIRDFKSGGHYHAGYAVSEDVLRMMRDNDVSCVARDIGEALGAHIYAALQK